MTTRRDSVRTELSDYAVCADKPADGPCGVLCFSSASGGSQTWQTAAKRTDIPEETENPAQCHGRLTKSGHTSFAVIPLQISRSPG